MAYFLYNILLHASVLALVPYFIVKMVSARKYREGIPERFGIVRKAKLKGLANGKVVWVHAVSVGETKAVLPLVRSLKKRNPGIKIIFSTVTATGNRTAFQEGKGLIDALIYFPLDLPWAIGRVVKAVKPSLFVVVEKEIWPNAFRAMKKAGAAVAVVNGTISDRSCARFKKLSFFFNEVFGMVDLFLARTPDDLKKAVSAGVPEDRASVTGNIKFDLCPHLMDRQFVDNLKGVVGIGAGSKVIVAGSTHHGEEEIILSAYKALCSEKKGLKLVLAPRHPERFNEVEAIIRRTGLSCARRSKGGGSDILLLDSIGELMAVYSLSDIAIVGGSFVPGIGGHNLLEPAYFGKPVLYGNHLTTYIGMAEMLEKEGGGIRVADEGDLVGTVKGLLSNELMMKRTGANARKVVEENRGASDRTVAAIEGLLRS